MSFGMPRLVANRFAVPAGMIARLAFEPASTSMQRCTIPSPPQAKTSSAPSSSARRTCGGALRLFGTSHQSGSSTAFAPRARGAAPTARRRAVLPECAITATFICGASAVGSHAVAAGEHDDDQRGDPDEQSAGDVERMVHAAVHPRGRDERHHRQHERPGHDAEGACS